MNAITIGAGFTVAIVSSSKANSITIVQPLLLEIDSDFGDDTDLDVTL